MKEEIPEETADPTVLPEEGAENQSLEEEQDEIYKVVGVFACEEDFSKTEEELEVDSDFEDVGKFAKTLEGYEWTGEAFINDQNVSAISDYAFTSDGYEVSYSELFESGETVYVEFPYEKVKEEYETEFEYEDSRVKITAEAKENAKLAKGTEIRADYLAPGSREYNDAVSAILLVPNMIRTRCLSLFCMISISCQTETELNRKV